MQTFREPGPSEPPEPAGPADREAVRRLIGLAVRPGCFFAGGGLELAFTHVAAEEAAWEVFQGRLLPPAQTRQRRTFEAWNVHAVTDGVRSEEPLVSVRLDTAAGAAGQVHVTRAILTHAWEAYDAGDNVILSREVRRWLRELVGTIDLARVSGAAAFWDELVCLVFRAVVGLSRLPLTSVEAPLPAFALGQLTYVGRPGPGATRESPWTMTADDLAGQGLAAGLARVEQVKLLEAVLRSAPAGPLDGALERFARRWEELGGRAEQLVDLLRELFNDVSLSPYTGVVGRAREALAVLQRRGDVPAAGAADFLAHLLRQAGRHLTAFDLVLFHHRGANYPDALMLDEVLGDLLARVEQQPELFLDAAGDDAAARRAKRLRRRGLRQGWMLRRRYEGHLVPDAPTSPGENARVLPGPYERVPEEQLTQTGKRKRRLFPEPLPLEGLGAGARAVLEAAAADLHHPDELRELGTALFLDRPLGRRKGPMEQDHTMLLSSVAFSRSVLARRLLFLAGPGGLLDRDRAEALLRELDAQPEAGLPLAGLPLAALPAEARAARPATASLGDAARVAEDFVFLRTTRRGVRDFLAAYDLAALPAEVDRAWLDPAQPVLIVPGPEGTVRLYDARFQPRLELRPETSPGWVMRAGVEYPGGGLRLVRSWETDGREQAWPEGPVLSGP